MAKKTVFEIISPCFRGGVALAHAHARWLLLFTCPRGVDPIREKPLEALSAVGLLSFVGFVTKKIYNRERLITRRRFFIIDGQKKGPASGFYPTGLLSVS